VPPDRQICLDLGFLEIVSILVRKRNDGRIAASYFKQAMIDLRRDILENEYFLLDPIDSSRVISSAVLVEKHNINATDAILLHSALKIQERFSEAGGDDELVLLTADGRFARAAAAEHLPVLNPETDRWPTASSEKSEEG
jgi:predicted nucleic acid-binding protein